MNWRDVIAAGGVQIIVQRLYRIKRRPPEMEGRC